VARWAGGAKWGEAPAPHDQRDMPLSLSLSEGLGVAMAKVELPFECELWHVEIHAINAFVKEERLPIVHACFNYSVIKIRMG